MQNVFRDNESPLVSVIITTFNGASFIEETIESIRSQTYGNWELVIMDDGSTDATPDIIEAIQDDRIFLYRAGRIAVNGRLKNMALEKTRGDLVAFIDHDDLWSSDKLEIQLQDLLQFPGAGFSLTGGYHFTTPGQPITFFNRKTEGIEYRNIFQSIFLSQIGLYTQALLVKKTCIEKAGNFNESSQFADPGFMTAIAYYFDGVINYKPLAFHRLHERNYSIHNWMGTHREGIDVIKRYRREKKLKPFIARNALFHSFIHFGEKSLGKKQYVMAIRSFVQAWQQRPWSLVPLKKTIKTLLRVLNFK